MSFTSFPDIDIINLQSSISFPDIDTIKRKSYASTSYVSTSYVSDTDYEDSDVDVNNVLQKYLNMNSSSISHSPSNINTIKLKISTSADLDYEDCHINDLLQKYLNTASPSSSHSSSLYTSSASASASASDSSDCDFLFDDNNDSDSDADNDINTNDCNKYHIDVPSISIQPIASSSDVSNSTTFSLTCSTDSSHSVIYSPSHVTDHDSSIILSSSETSPILSLNNGVEFDIECMEYKYFLSSTGFNSDYYEWTIKILMNDSYRQEIGIVSCIETKTEIGNYCGIGENKEFGERIIYGNIYEIDSFYNRYYDGDNVCKYNKNLSSKHCWSVGDEIKICLDLNKGCIQFMLNNEMVTETINVNKNIIYYPFISFAGNCKFKVIC